MKKRNIVIPVLLVMIIGILSFKKFGQQGNEPWKADQLIEPSALKAIINDPSANQPIIYSIGFGDEMGFTNQKLLNLSHNLKAGWIDNGYPVTQKQ